MNFLLILDFSNHVRTLNRYNQNT